MKIKLLLFSIIFVLSACNSKKVILKTYFFEGKNSQLTRSFEYNTKNSTYLSNINGNKEIKNFRLKDSDKKIFLEKLKNIKINDNFCWESIDKKPEYSWKYEIILNKDKQMPNCTSEPVKYEIFEAYNAIKDTIRKRIQ